MYPPSLDLDSLTSTRPSPPRGLFGSGMRSLRATPEQERQSRELEAYFGMSPGAPAQTMDAPPDQPMTGLLGSAPERPKGFWQGGDKFRARDGIAGLLAAVGDAFAQQSGYKGDAVANLGGMRGKGINAFEEALAAYQRNRQIASLPGMTPREYAAYSLDPKGWGSHMSDALSSHHAAANVSPGEQRVYGNPDMGGSIYQAPTSAEQYAGSLGQVPGTPGYNTSLQDYVLRGSGPTAFGFDTQLDDHRTQNDMGLEGLRQRNRIGLEDVRQGNRMEARSAPTYRDMNPPAPRARAGSTPRRSANPTATGQNGEKYEYNGKEWVRIN